jgi:ribosomal-protein-alanine N-acetyltransferase
MQNGAPARANRHATGRRHVDIVGPVRETSGWALVPMTTVYAQELLHWEYPPPFQRYSMLDADTSGFSDPVNRFFALVDSMGELVGFRSFGPDGRVPGGAYDDTALDMGGGLRPDLTGHGLGRSAIQIGIDFGWRTFDTRILRVSVWAKNERALKVLRSLGFAPIQRFVAATSHEAYLVLTLTRD